MNNFLANKSELRVLLIEPTTSVRMMMSDTLKSLGYKKTQSFSSLKDALSVIEQEPVNWIITSLFPTEEINAFGILKMITDTPSLKHIVVSLLVDPETEKWCLTKAFELGLLSYHKRTTVPGQIQKEFEELASILSINKGNFTLTSAEYLRNHLKERGHHNSRGELEQKLLSLFPGNPHLLVCLAEVKLDQGDMAKGQELLTQAELIEPKLSNECKKIRSKYAANMTAKDGDVPKEEEIPVEEQVQDILGLKNVLVVDPDKDILDTACLLLKKMGVKNIHTFENGKDAFEWLKEAEEPDLVFMEWRIPGLSGPLLIQRIRQRGFFQVPIIIGSSLVKKDEKPLLKEMGADEILEKPYDPAAFYSAIIWTVQQDRTPTEQKTIQRKIRRLFAGGKFAQAETLTAQLISDPRTTEGAKKSMMAEYEFSKRNYAAAVELGATAIELGEDSIQILNLIGKCFMHLRRFDAAMTFFEKASKLSPMNVDHLLKIAEINIEQNNAKAAKESIDASRSLDPTNSAVVETQVKYEVEFGSERRASKLMGQLDSGNKLTAYMNNKAVSLVRNARFDEGIVLYKKALNTIPDKWKDLKFQVKYNLALAYARHSDYENALQILTEMDDEDVSTAKKSRSLRRKIEKATSSGEPLFDSSQEGTSGTQNDEAQNTGSPVASDFNEILSKLDAKKGGICCYMIYQCLEGHDPENEAVLKLIPAPKRRLAS